METMTMTESNTAIAQKGFTDFLSGNIQAVLDACTADISWGAWENPVVPFSKTYHGKAGVAEFFSTLANSVTYSAFEPRAFFESGNKVFAKVNQVATVNATGKTFGHEALMEFTMSEGKISGFFAYVDSADQRQAFLID